jgi:hypothetical protein
LIGGGEGEADLGEGGERKRGQGYGQLQKSLWPLCPGESQSTGYASQDTLVQGTYTHIRSLPPTTPAPAPHRYTVGKWTCVVASWGQQAECGERRDPFLFHPLLPSSSSSCSTSLPSACLDPSFIYRLPWHTRYHALSRTHPPPHLLSIPTHSACVDVVRVHTNRHTRVGGETKKAKNKKPTLAAARFVRPSCMRSHLTFLNCNPQVTPRLSTRDDIKRGAGLPNQ